MADTQAKSKELKQVLWDGADILRNKMDANEYKNYLLGIVFYKYLSDKYLVKAYDLIKNSEPSSIEDAQRIYEDNYENDNIRDDLLNELKSFFHYTIDPDLTYTKLAAKAAANSFQREELQKAFNDIEQSDKIYADLFSDIDLYANKLGASEQKKSSTIAELLMAINKADLLNHDGDILGDAYEYLIGQFASETGKKAGEFYTPKQVAKILDLLSIDGQENKKGLSVYDPCMGSGSLMLNMRNYSDFPKLIRYYGQELNTNTYNLARMNLILHDVDPENQHLSNGDTLDADWPTDEPTNFDCVVMNPPYSAKWSAKSGFLTDSRYSDFGVLAPKGYADYAFLLHGFYHLKNTGTMAIVLPHGVLFRGKSEGEIRKKLVESGRIYAVIGLPPNLFYNTDIPTCIVVLKKEREERDVLFIDASKLYEANTNQNVMSEKNIEHVLDLYKDRRTCDKEAYLASFDEIKKNNFNLNIPRYIDTFVPSETVDVSKKIKELKDTKDKEDELLKNVDDIIKSLAIDGAESATVDEILSGSIRFRDDDGNSFPSWQAKKVGDLIKQSSLRNKDGVERPVYSVSNSLGFIPQNSQFDGRENIASDDRTNYKVVKPGYIAYNPARINVGSIAQSKLNFDAIVSPMYVVFELDKSVDSDFLMLWLLTDGYKKQRQSNLEGSVRQILSFDALSEMKILLPSLAEQKKIAEFLTLYDQLIKIGQDKVNILSSMKMGFLQKVFNQTKEMHG